MWLEVQRPAEAGLAYVLVIEELSPKGILLTRTPHTGCWYYYVDGTRYRITYTSNLEKVKLTVESKVQEILSKKKELLVYLH